MATVGTVLDLLDSMIGKNASQLGDKKIAMLNAGKTEVWKIITGSTPEENWFGHESQSSSSGDADYFPLLSDGVREYTLPSNISQLRLIEPVTVGFTEIDFRKSNIEKEDFRRRRRDNVAMSDACEVLYDIWGVNPGRLIFAANPAASIEVKLWYIRNPTEWAARDDSVDEFPPTMHTLICEWAAARIGIGSDDKRAALFHAAWSERVTHQLRVYRRDISGPQVVTGMFE